MKLPHLVPRKNDSKTYFHFRGCIPKDLIPRFFGRKEFQISLKDVNNKETILVFVSLQNYTKLKIWDKLDFVISVGISLYFLVYLNLVSLAHTPSENP